MWYYRKRTHHAWSKTVCSVDRNCFGILDILHVYKPEVLVRYSPILPYQYSMNTVTSEEITLSTCIEQQLSNLCSKIAVRAGYLGAGRHVRSLAGRLHVTITKSASH
jgi:hypothetical protein